MILHFSCGINSQNQHFSWGTNTLKLHFSWGTCCIKDARPCVSTRYTRYELCIKIYFPKHSALLPGVQAGSRKSDSLATSNRDRLR